MFSIAEMAQKVRSSLKVQPSNHLKRWGLEHGHLMHWRKWLLVLSLAPATANGDLIRIESESLWGLRRNAQDHLASPLEEFFQLHYLSDEKGLSFDSSFSLYDDPVTLGNQGEFHLYTMNLRYGLLENRLQLSLGRSFNSETSVKPLSMDLLNVEYALLKRELYLGTFLGYEGAQGETSSSDLRSQVAGLYLNYRPHFLDLPRVRIKFERRQTDTTLVRSNNLFAYAFLQPLPGHLSPEVYVEGETYLENLVGRKIEVGADLYPNTQSSIGVSYLRYEDQDALSQERTLFSIFSQGVLQEYSVKMGYQIRRFFVPSLKISYDEYPFQGTKTTSGGKMEVGFVGQSARNRYEGKLVYLKSYGGWLTGLEISASQTLIHDFELLEKIEVGYYEKITQSKRWVFSSQMGMNAWVWNHFRLYFGGELNNNNLFAADARVLAKLTYLFWKEL